KKRLYVALYPSGVTNNEERKYHWGFLVGPKHERDMEVPGTRYHVKNHPVSGWVYEEAPLGNVQSTGNLLARVLIAKVVDEARLAGILRGVPVVQADPSWRCRTWLASALAAIRADGPGRAVGTAELDWNRIERVAREYVARKTGSGRYTIEQDAQQPKPTWDMLQRKETIP
ncbi:hypothetical protein P885DRAFT_47641, partial [Corynascus similis CBS 632.67]